MRGPGGRSIRTLATAALLAGLTALASALACSLIVDGIPSIVYCDPNGGTAVCGTGQVCAPPATGNQYSCVEKCPNTMCRSGWTCGENHWCVQIDDTGPRPEASDNDASDAAVPEVVAVDVLPMTDAEAGPADVQLQCTGFGCTCASNSECTSFHVCVDEPAITTELWNAWVGAGGQTSAKHICARPCCTSSDCDLEDGGNGNSVCFATGRGGNYCVPKDLLHDRSTIGSAAGGASCTGTECRSGLCTDSGVCTDTCCSARSSSQCTGNTTCRIDIFPGGAFDTHLVANCSEGSPFSGGQGQMCRMPSDCRSNLCVSGTNAGFAGSYCEDPCRNANDCPTTIASHACEYVQPDPMGMSTDIVAGCVAIAFGADAGAPVCFVDIPGSSGDCPTGGRCRPESLTVGAMNMTYSVLACGM